jgi:hypothetical protein
MKQKQTETETVQSKAPPAVAVQRLVRARPLRWRKGKRYSGQMRLPETHELFRAGERIATVQAMSNGSYYWYGAGYNTAHKPTTLEEAKRSAEETIRRNNAL